MTQTRSADPEYLDTIFSLLSNQRRRHVVDILADRQSAVALDELANNVAARERGLRTDRSSQRGETEVKTELHHVHLPRLSDARVVSYDSQTRRVTPERTERFLPILHAAADTT